MTVITPMSEIMAEARRRMNEHGLEGWTLKEDRAKTRAGYCQISARTISLSRELLPLWPAEVVTDTILHEIAHALAPELDGHTAAWREIHISIGGTGERLFSDSLPRPIGKAWRRSCGCQPQTARKFPRRADAACLWCNQRYGWRRDGEPIEAAKPYSMKNSVLETADMGVAMGGHWSGYALRAPRWHRWANSETHYAQPDGDYPEARETFRADVEGGLIPCGEDCDSCRFP